MRVLRCRGGVKPDEETLCPDCGFPEKRHNRKLDLLHGRRASCLEILQCELRSSNDDVELLRDEIKLRAKEMAFLRKKARDAESQNRLERGNDRNEVLRKFVEVTSTWGNF